MDAYPVTEATGEEIRVALVRKRWSQAELARRCGVSEVFVSRRLSGLTPMAVDELAMFADEIGVPMEELLRARRYSKPQPSDPKSDTPVDKRYSGNIPAARQPNTTGIQITESGTAAVPVSGRVAYLESTPNSSDQTIIIPRQFGAGRRIC